MFPACEISVNLFVGYRSELPSILNLSSTIRSRTNNKDGEQRSNDTATATVISSQPSQDDECILCTDPFGNDACMMKEYFGEKELTEELIWTDKRGRSFIKSGDIGSLDEDGFLTILDRKKDMIISGGLNVFPVDIEEIVGTHPDIMDVTVIGIPHEKWGETCLALIIPKNGIEIDCGNIKEWSNAKLAKHQRLHNVEVREDFPRNALGKVLKRVLREPYWS